MTTIEIHPQALGESVRSLQIRGEIDISTASSVKTAVDELVAADCRKLVIDLGGVTYIDSTGLVAIINTIKRMKSMDGRVAFVCTNPHIAKVFRITGLAEVMEIFPTTADAARQVEAAER